MSKNCVIMQRMKENYEKRGRSYLTRRIPVIMRIDGKAFHTYTKGLVKPFDAPLVSAMEQTTKFLLANIQGAQLGYCQSDEISILITDYKKLSTDAWFGYESQKMCSIASSLATGMFERIRIRQAIANVCKSVSAHDLEFPKIAAFDARAFNIPKEEMANYFIAREKDAIKNSISSVAQSLYSHQQLNKKNQKDMLGLIRDKGQNWQDYPLSQKQGSIFLRNEEGIIVQHEELFTQELFTQFF